MPSRSSSTGEAALVAMAVGGVLIVMCAISIALAIRRRRRQSLTKNHRRLTVLTGDKSATDSRFAFQPTDFMNNLASWDRCHPLDEDVLEKRRRAVWTLELFENHGIEDLTPKPVHPKQLQDC